ncbi:MAG: MFS transporter [Candidatus Nanopelagicales bacterium]
MLISDNTGSDLAVATALLSLLIAGIAVGRTLGAGLTRRWSVTRLILGSLLLAGAGFLIVWSATALEVAAVGLFVTGVGFALLFPLTSSVAIGHAHGRTDKAIAIIAVVMGLTMGAAPFALGALAGAVGVTAGFAVVPLLLLVGAGAVVVANRLSGNRVPNGPATHPDR